MTKGKERKITPDNHHLNLKTPMYLPALKWHSLFELPLKGFTSKHKRLRLSHDSPDSMAKLLQRGHGIRTKCTGVFQGNRLEEVLTNQGASISSPSPPLYMQLLHPPSPAHRCLWDSQKVSTFVVSQTRNLPSDQGIIVTRILAWYPCRVPSPPLEYSFVLLEDCMQ